jgi:hypothetical protein
VSAARAATFTWPAAPDWATFAPVRYAWLLLLLTSCDALPPELVGGQRAATSGVEQESCDPLGDGPDTAADGAVSLSKRALPAGAHYTVLSGVTLSTPVATRLVQIDDDFARRSGGTHLTIVSGTRDAARQARAMYQVLHHGGNLLKLYEDRESALEIKQAHDRALSSGKSPAEAIAAIQAVLQDQIAHGIYISAHLRAGAVDVRSISMTAAERRAFRAVAQETPGLKMLEEQHPPHFHLQLE